MNIIGREQMFDLTNRWNGQGLERIEIRKSGQNRWDKGFVEDNDDFKNFLKKYEDIFTNDKEIKETDSVYFFKESKYPRFKFNTNCKNNKTINISKADVIITPQLNFVHPQNYKHYHNKRLIICTDTNNVYNCIYDDHHFQGILEPYFHKGNIEDNLVAFLQHRLLIAGNNYKIIYASALNSDVSSDFFNKLYENIDKCVSETSLEKYLSKESAELTDDVHKQLDLMFQSKDAGSVELGMKMLVNFDIDKNALKLGLLIRRHRDNLARNKAATSVGFKNVLKQLGINLQDGVPTLNYINNLYKNTQDEENKALMIDAFRKQLHSHLLDSYETYMRNMDVPTSINIDIT